MFPIFLGFITRLPVVVPRFASFCLPLSNTIVTRFLGSTTSQNSGLAIWMRLDHLGEIQNQWEIPLYNPYIGLIYGRYLHLLDPEDLPLNQAKCTQNSQSFVISMQQAPFEALLLFFLRETNEDLTGTETNGRFSWISSVCVGNGCV